MFAVAHVCRQQLKLFDAHPRCACLQDEMASAAAAKGGADGGLLDSLESKKKPFSFVSGPAAKLFMGAVDALINVVGEFYSFQPDVSSVFLRLTPSVRT